MRHIYRAVKYEYSIPFNERYYCPWPDCGIFVPEDDNDTPYDRARCKLKHLTCKKCLGAAHNDPLHCKGNRDLQVVAQMADQEGWKRCPKCRTMIEHRSDCRRMHCRCGAEFCFVYGAKWWTCGCTERQLKELKDRVARLKETRQEMGRVAQGQY